MSRPGQLSIVTYDHGHEIEACLDGALAQERDDLAVEVVVADDASRDDTAERGPPPLPAPTRRSRR